MPVPANAPILTCDAMRTAERACVAAGKSLAELMEQAGAAVADVAWRMASGAPILILVGPGNNGGDGYVAARRLAARGADVRIAALAAPVSDLARAAHVAWGRKAETIDADLAGAPVIVDALFGVGLTRPLADDLAVTLKQLGRDRSRILAVDVPSGVDGDAMNDWTPPLPADVTIALGALKPAHVLLPAADHCGEVLLAPIGIVADRAMHCVPSPRGDVPHSASHKFNRGMVLVRSGPMQGASDLASAAALRAGAGYVVLNGDHRARLAAIVVEPRADFAKRLVDPRLGAIVIGPGYPAGKELNADVGDVVTARKPAVFDAAAIDAALPLLRGRMAAIPAILTPHEGEFARAFSDLAGNKIDRARAAAAATGAVVVYKGADSVIAAPDGRVAAAWPGSPWLATAGTGDILAGACAAMLARGGDAFDAAVAAVGWHIERALAIGAGLVADDLVGPIS